MIVDDATVSRVALLAEELLTRPDGDELVAELRARVPAEVLDQHDAAAAELRAGIDRMISASGGDLVEDQGGDDLPRGMLLGVCVTVVGWRAGRGATCEHTADPRIAQPVLLAAWRPDLVVCTGCPHLLALPRGSAADRTCDGCGRVTAGVEHGDGVCVGAVVAGSVTAMFGLCRECKEPTRDQVAS